MSIHLETNVKLLNGKMKFEARAESHPPIITDYVPPFVNCEGYMPLQLFLISLSTCLGGSITLLLGRMEIKVEDLEIKATGQRRQEHPTCFEKINLAISLKSPNGTQADLEKAVALSQSKFCPVLAMIDKSIEIGFEYSVRE